MWLTWGRTCLACLGPSLTSTMMLPHGHGQLAKSAVRMPQHLLNQRPSKVACAHGLTCYDLCVTVRSPQHDITWSFSDFLTVCFTASASVHSPVSVGSFQHNRPACVPRKA